MNEQLLRAIRERQADKKTPFGYGILTADRYVQNMVQHAGKHHIAGRKQSYGDVMLKASQTLVYSNEDMEVLEKQMLDSTKQFILEDIELPKNTLMVFRHVLTTPRKDRDGDVLRTEGAIIDPRMPLLWQHVHTLPIGKMLAVAEHNSKRLVLISAIVDLNELSHDAAVMVDNDMARFSHGFRALEFSELKETEGETTGPGGFDVKRFEIMEESIVSVPSNVDAEVDELLVSLVEGGKLTSGLMKDYGKSLREAMPLMVASGINLKGLNDENESGNGSQAEGKAAEAGTPEEADATSEGQEKATDQPQVTTKIEVPDKYASIDFSVTSGMVEEAKKGLAWREEFNRGGTNVGAVRANQIINDKELSPDVWKRMKSFFARHEVNKESDGWNQGEDGYPSAGRIAWALWGGDPGMTRASAVVAKMEKADEDDKSVDLEEKAGRALSKANYKMIVDSCDDLKEVMDTDKNMSRGSMSLIERACRRLEKVIESAGSMEEEEGKEVEVDATKAMSIFLQKSTDEQQVAMIEILRSIRETAEFDQKWSQLSSLLG